MRVHSWVVCLYVIVLAGLLYGQGGANGTPSPRDRVLDPGPPRTWSIRSGFDCSPRASMKIDHCTLIHPYLNRLALFCHESHCNADFKGVLGFVS